MALAGLLVDLPALVAKGWSLAAVPQLRGHEFDRTVAMLMHVPVDECSRLLAGLILAGKGPTGVLRPVIGRAEQRLGVLVLALDSRRRKKERSTPSSSSSTCSVAARMVLPLSACRIGWCCLLIHFRQ